MADYINYYDLKVDLLALLNQMALNVLKYVYNLPWSKNKKKIFLDAYSDMVSRGIKGIVRSENGLPSVEINGEELDGILSNLPEKFRRIYGLAADFIEKQAASLAQSNKTEEKKEEKTPFGSFRTNFLKHVSNLKFGGEKFTTGQWNEFDERDKFGIRGKNNRMKMLSDLLQSYSDSVTDDKFDFTGTPYKDASELKGRIQEAITALRTEDKRDDMEKLYAIGLDPAEWFNDGSGDPSGHVDTSGNPVSYKDWNEYNVKVTTANILKKIKNFKHKPRTPKTDIENERPINEDVSLSLNNTEYNNVALAADLSSFIGDIVSLGGGLAGVGGSAWSLGSDVVSDIARGKDLGSILSNAGTNLAWLGASLVPGGKTGRLIQKGSALYGALQTVMLTLDPDVRKSVDKTWKKILDADFSNINGNDIENLKHLAHAITGNVNGVRGWRATNKILRALDNNKRNVRVSKTETTPEGTTRNVESNIELTNNEIRSINRAGLRGGNEAALKLFLQIRRNNQEKLVLEGQFDFGQNGRAWYNPARYYQSRAKTGKLEEAPIDSRYMADLYTQAEQRLNSGWHPFKNSTIGSTRGVNSFWNLKTWGIRSPRWNSDASGRRTLAYLEGEGYYGPPRTNTPPNVNPAPSGGNSTPATGGTITAGNPTPTGGTSGGGGTPVRTSLRNPILSKEEYKELQSTLKGINYSSNPVIEAPGATKGIGDIYVIKDPSGRDLFLLQIRGKDGKTYSTEYVEPSKFKEEALKTAKEVMRANISKETNVNLRHKINLDFIRELKRIGALKQGGKITDTLIDNFLK